MTHFEGAVYTFYNKTAKLFDGSFAVLLFLKFLCRCAVLLKADIACSLKGEYPSVAFCQIAVLIAGNHKLQSGRGIKLKGYVISRRGGHGHICACMLMMGYIHALADDGCGYAQ